jgi:ketosteroid isomerase-like protein
MPTSIGCDAVRLSLDRFRQAYDAGSVERLMALYSADARENGTRGWSGIRQLYVRWFDETSGRRIRFNGIAIRLEDRDRCLASAGYHVGYRDTSGRGVERSGTIEFVFERRETDFRIVRLDY